MNKFRAILDSHEQIFPASCTASVIELVLKLHKKVNGGYNKIQSSYKNANTGYKPFQNRNIHGIHFGTPIHWKPPFTGLGIALQKEIDARRYPIISIKSGEEMRDGKPFIIFHEWIVFAPRGNSFLAASKILKRTVFLDVHLVLAKSPHTDTLFYTIP